jgi:hypothetical protein
MDEQAGVTSTIKETAADLNTRCAARCVAARGARA